MWEGILKEYIENSVMPDGRDTFESKVKLQDILVEKLLIKNRETLVDIGCGRGALIKKIVGNSSEIIAIEPDIENLNFSKKFINDNSVKFIQGSFTDLNFDKKVDRVVSSLVFHQVKWKEKASALKSIRDILKNDGFFILCDVILLFNPYDEIELFDKTYRFLLEKTTPKEVYKRHIAPHMNNNNYVYTIENMKKYSKEDNWFYTLDELKEWIDEVGLVIVEIDEILPFFGILKIKLK